MNEEYILRSEVGQRLRKVAEQYRAGGHTHRAKMLVALADEFNPITKAENLHCDCGAFAEWLIGTAKVPTCSEHHKFWLLRFNYKTLHGNSVRAERLTKDS